MLVVNLCISILQNLQGCYLDAPMCQIVKMYSYLIAFGSLLDYAFHDCSFICCQGHATNRLSQCMCAGVPIQIYKALKQV